MSLKIQQNGQWVPLNANDSYATKSELNQKQDIGNYSEVTISTIQPTDQDVGDLWFDPSDEVDIEKSCGISINVSDNEPTNPSVGDLWLDTDAENKITENWKLIKDITLTEAVRSVDTGVKLTDYEKIIISVNSVQNTSVETCHWQWNPKGISDSKTIIEGIGFHNTQRRTHVLFLEHIADNYYRMFIQFSASISTTDISNNSLSIWGTTKDQGIYQSSSGTGNICFMPYQFADENILLASDTRYCIWGVKA